MKNIRVDDVTYQMLVDMCKKSPKHRNTDDFICSLISDTYHQNKKR